MFLVLYLAEGLKGPQKGAQKAPRPEQKTP